MDKIVETPLSLGPGAVWVPEARGEFGYSDGEASERYLERVFREVSDLSAGSPELEARMRDWPSEYHLCRERTQLLDPFSFERSQRVLEVGCGCGAITRFLGETFDEVVSVDGSYARARLARLRTRDLESVSIVSSPFQELRFRTSFDTVFCIGVLEYANAYIDSPRPYETALDHFVDALGPEGTLILAIENQFGLKYFASSAEDHNNRMFEGIEGYHRFPRGARTFGYAELRSLLEPRFSSVEFYFPLPDYKLPSCVISEEMLAQTRVAELIGSFASRDHGRPDRARLFDEALAWVEIERNGLVPFFAPSFLVVARKGARRTVSSDWLGTAYSNRRRPEFATRTRFLRDSEGVLRVHKERRAGGASHVEGRLEHRAAESRWIDGPSLQRRVAERALDPSLSLAEVFEPIRPWLDALAGASVEDVGRRRVPGEHLDSLWRNCFVTDGECRFIDREWIWREDLPLNVVVMRAAFYFFKSLQGARDLGPALRGRRISRLISDLGDVHGLDFTKRDRADLVALEAEFLHRASSGQGRSLARRRVDTRRMLHRKLDPRLAKRLRRLPARAWSKLRTALRR